MFSASLEIYMGRCTDHWFLICQILQTMSTLPTLLKNVRWGLYLPLMFLTYKSIIPIFVCHSTFEELIHLSQYWLEEFTRNSYVHVDIWDLSSVLFISRLVFSYFINTLVLFFWGWLSCISLLSVCYVS